MDAETFTLLPLHLDPTSKSISCPSLPSTQIATELTELNTLHRLLLNITDSPLGTNIPPPPLPLNPKRGAQIAKMREQANTLMRRARREDAEEAVKLYTYALTMSTTRPPFEPHQNTIAELSQLYANRAQAHLTLHNYPEAAADAETSVELKKAGNGKAWWRRGRCLVEMGRWGEAREWVERWRDAGDEGGEGEKEGRRELEGEIEGHYAKVGRGRS
ncbi:hypothetical protein MMC08_008610 [Hypocenomyce scalaris]|nr:hypothetical protein [Hypocenomyce scalaris]